MRSMAGMTLARLGLPREKYVVPSLKICKDVWSTSDGDVEGADQPDTRTERRWWGREEGRAEYAKDSHRAPIGTVRLWVPR